MRVGRGRGLSVKVLVNLVLIKMFEHLRRMGNHEVFEVILFTL